MPGADETLADHRERKRIAADKYSRAQRDLVKKRFTEQILPDMVRIFDATCVGINTANKTISVRFDPVHPDLRFLNLEASIQTVPWDRNRLTTRQVLNKRLKILLRIRNGIIGLSLGAITT